MRILHEDDENEDFDYDRDEDDLDLDDDEERDEDIEDERDGNEHSSASADIQSPYIEDWRSMLLPPCPLTFQEAVTPPLEEFRKAPRVLSPRQIDLPDLRRKPNKDDDEDDFGVQPMGYTTVLQLLTYYRWKLAEHRKDKKLWKGRAEEYRTEERRLVAKVWKYKERSAQPYYAKKIKRAKNRARRKYRKPLKHILTLKSPEAFPDWWERSSGHDMTDKAAHLPWMLTRIRKKRFKTRQHLAYCYRKPIEWIQGALAEAVKLKMITEEELKACFPHQRRPGRPRIKKVVPRGSYRKRGTQSKQGISTKLLLNLDKV